MKYIALIAVIAILLLELSARFRSRASVAR